MKKSLAFKNIIYFIILFSLSLNSQNSNFSELDSTYEYLSEKYYEYKFTDTIKAKNYADRFLQKATLENDTIYKIIGYEFLGEILKDDTIYLQFLDNLIIETSKMPTKMFPTLLYVDKGRHYIINGKNNESLKNYILALKYSNLYRNDSLKYRIKDRIASLKFENKQFVKAKKIRLEVYNFYNNQSKYRETTEYCALLINLTNSYISEKKYDSARIFNTKANKYANIIRDSIMIGYSLHGKGHIFYAEKKYKSAINSILKSLKWINSDSNHRSLSNAYSKIAKSYAKLGNQDKAVLYNLKIDSLYQKTNVTYKSQKSSYAFLINYYKNKNELSNQLLYIEKLLKVDSILNTRSKKLSKTFTEEYDIPKLKAEKEAVIGQLKDRSQKIIYFSIAFTFIIILILAYQIRKRIILKKRFEKILNSKKASLKKINIIEKQELLIPKEIIENILNGLEKFEKKKGFTNTSLTLNDFAIKLKTNTNYLSKIINHYKNKNFSNYLKDLRIAYAIEILDKNELIRKYTIKAIANEVGFNTAESFANAFYKKTGFKPSYYIKELNKRKTA
ncbi:hypothetical protein BW723_13075 [Polaribacter reichenbachii]|uniref:HTH araC/xylS-type domain-containing protein n=1 Tax=Polaribacter reichenbachii TaxID=996801 RepID=A0A1B8U051_9FLAO|nr:helix-turn-helix domain-containing protein [Polaribacter reichenbachii]APZ47157.1 hypothetical protein BW723_13075 [Polaribacter reichenbachii]AUC17797.1 hypothetical protein BTO17_03520 [Polaribacter reichenbachii]OBY65179.1 hypothetical protein LPB301_08705 [Polaribacter reichenbachii]